MQCDLGIAEGGILPPRESERMVSRIKIYQKQPAYRPGLSTWSTPTLVNGNLFLDKNNLALHYQLAIRTSVTPDASTCHGSGRRNCIPAGAANKVTLDGDDLSTSEAGNPAAKACAPANLDLTSVYLGFTTRGLLQIEKVTVVVANPHLVVHFPPIWRKFNFRWKSPWARHLCPRNGAAKKCFYFWDVEKRDFSLKGYFACGTPKSLALLHKFATQFPLYRKNEEKVDW